MSALGASDVYRLRIYEKVQSTSTQKVIDDTLISGTQTAQPVYVSAALCLLNGWTFTLVRVASTGGTDRSIAWSIRQVA